MEARIKINVVWVLSIIVILSLIPFLGLTEFSTKGEPREAAVAVSMLQQNNWILPVNNGFDIPYKPPFFHWCIAACSLITGGVTEFTSRLPSAIALIIILISAYTFFAKRKRPFVALLATMLTLTNFEVYRDAINCRVDMMLTMFIVSSLLLLYKWYENGAKQLPWLAILTMSGGTLTKGPIGIILPCFVMFVFMALQRENILKLIWKFALSAILSLILPSLWYYAAYQQGGEQFLNLVMEENMGRFLGKMTYESHENPAIYNFIMLLAGWSPWNILLLISLFFLPWKKFSRSKLIASARKADPLQLFVWLSFALILFFYCIPKSKRGVYLLPCYPFMAFLMAEYIVWLGKNKLKSLKIFLCIMVVLSLLLTFVFFIVRSGVIPDAIFHGRHAFDNINMLHAFELQPVGFLGFIFILILPLVAMTAFYLVISARFRHSNKMHILANIILILTMFTSIFGYYQPTAMNVKSLKPFAEMIKNQFGDTDLYAYTGKNVLGGNLIHFFGIDYYLGDKLRQFDVDEPKQGTLIINAGSKKEFMDKYKKNYDFSQVYRSMHRQTELKDTIYVYKFKRSSIK